MPRRFSSLQTARFIRALRDRLMQGHYPLAMYHAGHAIWQLVFPCRPTLFVLRPLTELDIDCESRPCRGTLMQEHRALLPLTQKGKASRHKCKVLASWPFSDVMDS
jgi:hypothetical protein